MRAINRPNLDIQIVYEACINSITDDDLYTRLQSIMTNIIQSSSDYGNKALISLLYTIPPNHCENDAIALGNVTKKELRAVYSSHFVPATKPARIYYDQLISLAPLGKCPYCGVGYASTLDHYLPKNKFPQLSVTPLNLIPSCKDCNTGKKTSFPTTFRAQSLHPYFDHDNFIEDQWLYANVIETTPAIIDYCVIPPSHWNEDDKARVHTHFNDFDLKLKYSIEASNQIAVLRDSLLYAWDSNGFVGVRQQLMLDALAYYLKHPNSWQTAMYQALAQSNWYCNGGFR
ncbi:HNH endonuclease [uncultured Acinetobacter sp.]|uniref:HNH endonuclease n=1 Tax=uncultured Acinetobacter sp. TaxID=165433 RepID=UPI00374A2F0B